MSTKESVKSTPLLDIQGLRGGFARTAKAGTRHSALIAPAPHGAGPR